MKSPAYRTLNISLAAKGERTVNASGSIIRVLTATDAFELSFGDDTFFETEAGLGYEPFYGLMEADGVTPQTFRTLRFRNPTDSAMSIRVAIGTGNIIDGRVVFGGAAVPVQPITFDGAQPVSQSGAPWGMTISDEYLPRKNVVGVYSGSSALTIGAGSYSAIYSNRTNRAAIWLHHRGTETVYIKSGGADTNGVPLFPGERFRIEDNTGLGVYNPASFSQTIGRVEENW